MTNSEKITSMISKKFFLEQFSYNEIYVKQNNQEKEFCDCLIEFNDVYIVVQIKERDASSNSSEYIWFDKKVVKTAKKQLKDTYTYFADTTCDIFSKSSPLSIDRTKTLIPLIIFYNNQLQDYQKVITSRSIPVDINIFSYQDFETMLETVVLPCDILKYLAYRTNFKTISPGKFLFDEVDDDVTVFGRPTTEKDFAEWFLARTYYKDIFEYNLSEERIAFYNNIIGELNKSTQCECNDLMSGFLFADYVDADKIAKAWIKYVDFSKDDVCTRPYIFIVKNIAYVLISRPKSFKDEEFYRYVECSMIYCKHKHCDIDIAHIISLKYHNDESYVVELVDVDLKQIEYSDELLEEVLLAFEGK